jgi:hypothetical protein
MTTKHKNETVEGPLAEGQRCGAARKHEVVLRLFRGESVDALSRELLILNADPFDLPRWVLVCRVRKN